MVLDPSNSSILESLALKGLISGAMISRVRESYWPWLSVKEKLGHSFGRRARRKYIVTEFTQCFRIGRSALSQSTEPRVWHAIQCSPHHLVTCTTHVEHHSPAVDASDGRGSVQRRSGGRGRTAGWRREREGGGRAARASTTAGRSAAAA